jgi:DNA-binding beta-propeller fold protein YncE
MELGSWRGRVRALAYSAGGRLQKVHMSRDAFLFLGAVVFALAGCGGGGGGGLPAVPPATPLGSLTDADAAADSVIESARPGAAVGLTLMAVEIAARGAVTFSLPNNADGAFAVNAATGVVTIGSGVDFEASASRTITARATSADLLYFAERDFIIAVTDSPAPVLELAFPFSHANYAHTTAGVSGRITHPDPASINVSARAGAAAAPGTVLADGRFFVKDIAVAAGTNLATITVTAAHTGKDADTEAITVGRAPDLSIVEAVIVDAARDRFLYADRYSGTIVAVARDGYSRSVVSGAGRGAGTELVAPSDLALDTQNDRLYVLDVELDAVLHVDPVSGDRVLVSGGPFGGRAGTGDSILTPTGIVYDGGRGRILVADDGRKMLHAVNPATGNRTVFSDNTAAFGPPLSFYGRLALDAPRNRALVLASGSNEIHVVDLATGTRALLSDGTDDLPDVARFFTGISVAPLLGVAYLADDFSNAVVRVSLMNGARLSVSSSGLAAGCCTHSVIGTGPELEWPTDVVFDETQNRLFVLEEAFADPLIEVDQASGNRELLTHAAIGAGINFKDLWGITLDAAERTAYVADHISDIVTAVDLRDGSRRLIAGSPTGRGTIATDPLALALDEVANELYVVDFTANSLYALNVATGTRRTVSDQSTGSGPPLDNPVDVALDSASGVAYVLDRGLRALHEVQLAGGSRRTVSGGGVGLGTSFGAPAGFELDLANRRAFVADASGNAIVSVDLATGDRTIVSSSSIGAGPRFGDLRDVALDAVRERLLALDAFPNRVMAVDLATGARTVLSGEGAGTANVGGGLRFASPRALDVDATHEIAFVTDGLYDAVIAVDLLSGFRQAIAR